MTVVRSTTATYTYGVNPKADTAGTAIPPAVLSHTSSKEPKNNIRFTLRGNPSPNKGKLMLGTTQVTTGTSWNISQNNVLKYVSDSSYYPDSADDRFIRIPIRVTDLNDNTFIDITFVIEYNFQDTAPQGRVGELHLKEGTSAKVTKNQINFSDMYDGPNGIFIIPQAWPEHGTLSLNGKVLAPGSKFTMDDVLNGKIVYEHNGDEAEEDHFRFKIRDAKNKWAGIDEGKVYDEANANVFDMLIVIKQIDLPLQVTEHGPVSIEKCGELTLTDADIMAEDEDDPGLEIKFTINSLPQHNLIKKNGTPMMVGSSFTLTELRAGAISIEQDCSDFTPDEFYFTASHTKQEVPNNRFQINLIPNKPPVVSVKALDVEKCMTGSPTDNITITDPEGLDPTGFEITITVLPSHGDLMLGGSLVSVGTKLTYGQILSGELVYKHDCTDHTPLTDSVGFTVTDGANEVPFTLPINILVTHTEPPFMTINKVQMTDRNGDVMWGVDEFNFDDVDTPPHQVYWEATALGQYGTFQIDKGDGLGFVPVDVGDKFTQAQWQIFKFRYVADNPPNSVMEDEIEFKLYDQIPNVVENLKLRIKFTEAPPDCPTVHTDNILTTYRTDVPITEVNIEATTANYGPEDHIFTLTKISPFARIMLDGNQLSVGSTWTQVEINEMRLVYVADTGTEEFDIIEFDVSNGYCTVSRTLRIDFVDGLVMVNNGPLELHIGIEGEENPSITADIPHELLYWRSGWFKDAPESTDNILYVISSIPLKGRLELNGVELEENSSFTQTDIDNGLLKYITQDGLTTASRDSFDYTVTDGNETMSATFEIHLDTTIPVPPVELINLGMTIGEQTCLPIRDERLNVLNPGAPASQVVFNVIETTTHGILSRNGVAIEDGGSFTLLDIQNGAIVYCETEMGALLDSFEFSVVIAGEEVFSNELFDITIEPPPPPELNNTGVSVQPCTERAITRLSLNVLNIPYDWPLDEIVFTITSLPEHGTLEVNAVPLEVGGTFTLLDIHAAELTYETFSFDQTSDSFTFDVTSAVFESFDNVFEITIVQGTNPPWVCVNEMMTVVEGSTNPITLDYLQMCDIDLDADNPPLDPENPGEPEDSENPESEIGG